MAWIIAIAGAVLPLLFTRGTDQKWEYYTFGIWTVGGVWFLTHMIKELKGHIVELTIAGVTAFLIYTGVQSRLPAAPAPHPVPEQPAKKRIFPIFNAFTESEGVGPGGVEVVTDLPPAYRKENISSRGAGCCVFRSGEHSAKYQNIPALYDWAEWMVKNGIVGGGYPEKVDKLLKQVCDDRGLPVPPYIQHTKGDPAFLEAALRNGLMPCVTYAGNDTRYRSGIDHMVNLVYLDDKNACILDNNFIDKYLWMSRDEFLKRWKDRGGGWAWVLLGSPPIPVLHNK